MRYAALMVVLGVAVGLLAGQVFGVAAEAPAKLPTLAGIVVKVEEAKVTVKAGEQEVVVVTDAKTAVTVDGKEAKVADLKAGQTVVVTSVEGTATKIEATTPKVEAPKAEAPKAETPKAEAPKTK
jgi:hypothetical protein